MTILIVLLSIGLVIGIIGTFTRISPSKSQLQVTRDETRFPIVSGYNLNREELEFPTDFAGEFNLVIVPFKQYQQNIVNTWIPIAQQLEQVHPGFIYYELPTIYEMPSFSRTFINEGMRVGIPDRKARERTITLYLDKEIFKSALDIGTEDEIYLFLVDTAGQIYWRSSGGFSEPKAGELIEVLKALRNNL
ncbi:MAG: hypothetical protein ACK2UE_06695 [Anaerolineales bacterium]|jgi:hypothetical protein